MANNGRTITFSVADRRTVNARFRAAMMGRKAADHISFASAELLMRVLTTKRLEILQAMAGKGPRTIRKSARLRGRAIHPGHRPVNAPFKPRVRGQHETRRPLPL